MINGKTGLIFVWNNFYFRLKKLQKLAVQIIFSNIPNLFLFALASIVIVVVVFTVEVKRMKEKSKSNLDSLPLSLLNEMNYLKLPSCKRKLKRQFHLAQNTVLFGLFSL